jgi:hypothetical protein
MHLGPASAEELAALGAVIERWVAGERERNPLLSAVERDVDIKRWYVRLRGEDKAVITVWLTLRERTLHYETWFMPAPEEQVAGCYEYLLRANMKMFGASFAVGPEDAVYLVGQIELADVDETALDRIIGSMYAYSERYFSGAMSIGYASRYRPI